MQETTDIPADFKETKQQIVTVRLWETDLSTNRNNLTNTLSLYALDKGPLRDADHPEMMCFRFTLYDWDKTLKQLFLDNGIPVLTEEMICYSDFMHIVKTSD